MDFADRVIGTLLDGAHEDLAYYEITDKASFCEALEKAQPGIERSSRVAVRPPNASLRPRQPLSRK